MPKPATRQDSRLKTQDSRFKVQVVVAVRPDLGVWNREPICASYDEECHEMTQQERLRCASPQSLCGYEGRCPFA